MQNFNGGVMQIMNTVKTVIFDMDGLMFDTEKIYYKSNQATADELGMDYTFEVYSQFIGAGYHEEYAGMLDIYSDVDLLDEYYRKAGQILEDSFLNGPVDLKPGLLELLEYLKAEDIPAVVASSTRRELVDQLLDRLEVRQYFVDVVGGDEVPSAKPDPAIFNLAFSKTGIEKKEHALILEDSNNGLLAANGAGIPAILIPDLLEPTDEMIEKAMAVLPDLHHVIDFIEEKNK